MVQIIIVPASASITGSAILPLLDHSSNPTVVGVYRDPAKAPKELLSYRNFNAVKGDVTDPLSLDFTGADAVLTMSPPKLDGSDSTEFTWKLSENVKAAARKANVRRFVYISSVGGQLKSGNGEIVCNFTAEQIFKDSAPEVVFIRPSYFHENWASSLETIKADPAFFYSPVMPLDHKIPTIARKDVGAEAAMELLRPWTQTDSRPRAFELHGPQMHSPLEVRDAFEAATGKKIEIRPVERHELRAFFEQVGVPGKSAENLEAMYTAMQPGGILDGDEWLDVEGHPRSGRRAKTSLKEGIAELVKSGEGGH